MGSSENMRRPWTGRPALSTRNSWSAIPAKVILSVRDPERWYESVRNTIYELSVVIPRHPIYRIGYKLVSFFVFRGPGIVDLAGEIIWQGTFHGRFEDKTYAIGVFERHSAEVRQRVPENRLLVYDVKSGWGPLCEFLGVEEPDEPFPRTNDTAEMQRRIRGVKALSFVAPVALLVLLITVLVLLWSSASLNSRRARRLRS